MNKMIDTILEEKGINKARSSEIVLMSKFSPVPYAERLMEENKFLYDKYNRFWRYDISLGIWREDAEEFIRHELREDLLGDEQQKKNYTEEVVSYIRDLNYNPNFEPQLQPTIIPFKNCLFELRTGEIISFSADYFVTSKIPVNLNKDKIECKKLDEFFSQIVGENYKVILYELCAYCLYDGYPYQKLFFLIGGGLNGKTTFLEVLRSFLGIENVSGISPQDLVTNRFALGEMWNKRANISSDISYEALKNVNKLKEITGGDTVWIERKFKHGFPAKINAKQIFSTNQVPITHDATMAWYRRIYLIEFPKKIENPNPMILQDLITEEQLEGLAWKCIEFLKQMYDNGFRFTFDIDVDKISQTYEDLSNPLHKFLRENTEEDSEGFIFKFEFRERFTEWLKENRLRIWSETELGIEIKRKYDEGKRSYWSDGGEPKQYRAWLGLKWANIQGISTRQGFNISSIYMIVSRKPLPLQTTMPSSFKPLENLNFMVLINEIPQEITLKADKTYEKQVLGDEANRILGILLESKKIVQCAK